MDPRLRTSVDTSLGWYADVFALHDIDTAVEDGLWRCLQPPPPLHSAAKTLAPRVTVAQVVESVAAFPGCAVADSFGDLDLQDAGFRLLFEATWLHHPALPAGPAPPGWGRLTDEGALSEWVTLHGTAGIFPPDVLTHPAFSLLARRDPDGRLTAGTVLHAGQDAVSASNTVAAPGYAVPWSELLALVAAIHPGRAITGYAGGADLADALASGFTGLGPQRVWLR